MYFLRKSDRKTKKYSAHKIKMRWIKLVLHSSVSLYSQHFHPPTSAYTRTETVPITGLYRDHLLSKGRAEL